MSACQAVAHPRRHRRDRGPPAQASRGRRLRLAVYCHHRTSDSPAPAADRHARRLGCASTSIARPRRRVPARSACANAGTPRSSALLGSLASRADVQASGHAVRRGGVTLTFLRPGRGDAASRRCPVVAERIGRLREHLAAGRLALVVLALMVLGGDRAQRPAGRAAARGARPGCAARRGAERVGLEPAHPGVPDPRRAVAHLLRAGSRGQGARRHGRADRRCRPGAGRSSSGLLRTPARSTSTRSGGRPGIRADAEVRERAGSDHPDTRNPGSQRRTSSTTRRCTTPTLVPGLRAPATRSATRHSAHSR